MTERLNFLRVECDFGAEGLWDERGSMLSVESLPIEQSLRNRLLAWNAWHDSAVLPWLEDDRYDWDLHRLTAIDIARWLVVEFPDWAIVAIDQRISPSGQVAERVPFPGEDGGEPFRLWRAQWLEEEG